MTSSEPRRMQVPVPASPSGAEGEPSRLSDIEFDPISFAVPPPQDLLVGSIVDPDSFSAEDRALINKDLVTLSSQVTTWLDGASIDVEGATLIKPTIVQGPEFKLSGHFMHVAVLPALQELNIELKESLHKAVVAVTNESNNSSDETSVTMVNRNSLGTSSSPSKRDVEQVNVVGEGEQVPVGLAYQADLPVQGQLLDISKESKYFGLKVWPLEGDIRELIQPVIGKGRDRECDCEAPGSMPCITVHKAESRSKLMSNLGHFGFELNHIGEEISNSWTTEDQSQFNKIMEENPKFKPSNFNLKTTKEIVNYYYNVFAIRKIRAHAGSGRKPRPGKAFDWL